MNVIPRSASFGRSCSIRSAAWVAFQVRRNRQDERARTYGSVPGEERVNCLGDLARGEGVAAAFALQDHVGAIVPPGIHIDALLCLPMDTIETALFDGGLQPRHPEAEPLEVRWTQRAEREKPRARSSRPPTASLRGTGQVAEVRRIERRSAHRTILAVVPRGLV